MNSTRFDRLARRFASRRMSRRTAMAAGAAGIASAGLGATSPIASAVDATPVATPIGTPSDPHAGDDTAQAHPEYLFVQPFDAGAWKPKAGEDGVYTLTLTGVAGQTTYFSDRPERDAGLAPTQPFLDGLGFGPENPPNAALVARNETGENEVLVVELFEPVYDENAASLTYEAKVLADYSGRGLQHLALQQTDDELPASFGEGSLFIDDCADTVESCWLFNSPCTELRDVGNITNGNCWNQALLRCSPCASYDAQCYSSFPDICTDEDKCLDDIAICGTPGCCAAQGGCAC